MKRVICLMLVFALALAAGGCGKKAEKTSAATLLGAAAVPKEKSGDLPEERISAALSDFSYAAACRLLSEENGNYSPVSLYFALALTASGAKGETQTELLSLLGLEQAEELTRECARLYNRLYTDTDVSQLLISNSLWLDREVLGQDIAFNQDYIDTATGDFYSSVFAADFSGAKTAEEMSEWIFKNTKGKLKPQFQVSPGQAMSIINTVYFYAEWTSRFGEEETKEDTFHLKDGSGVSCPFMNQTLLRNNFYIGEDYVRAGLPLRNGGEMILILPDEGVNLSLFLSSPDKLQDAFTGGEEKNGQVAVQLPKFKIESQFDLIPALKTLGVERAFDPHSADFSGMADAALYVSGAAQGTYIGIDEKGVEAAAYTKIDMSPTACPDEPEEFLDLVLDRPFLYGVTSEDGILLFVGVCMNPAA